MSYDIRFGVQTVMPNNEGEQFVVIGSPEYDSPTYNLRDMFVACMGWDYETYEEVDGHIRAKWHPMAEVLSGIERGIRELTENRAEYEKYNPPNGWGDLDGALRCLKNWKAEIVGGEYEKYGGETAKVWEWDVLTNRWPLEALWWRW